MRHGIALLLLAGTVQAQIAPPDSARPQLARPASYVPPVGPPIRQISTASAISKEKLGAINGVRELPDGRVLLNDGTSRRLLLLDTNLVLERVVLDSMSEHANTYGNRQGAIIPQRGDSTLFVDQNSMSMLILDPRGNIARVRSVPRADYVWAYSQTSNPVGTDAQGRIVFRMDAQPARPAKAPPRGVPWFPLPVDSAFIVALDPDSRKIDTLGSYKIQKWDFIVRADPNGGWNVTNNINPLPSTDDWAVLPDGAIAIVKAIDYHVEYRNPDGTWTSGPKLPFDWRPISDSARRALVDSVRTAQMKSARNNYTNALIRWVNTYRRKFPEGFRAPEGFVPSNGYQKSWTMPPGVVFPANYIYGCAIGEEPVITPDTASNAQPASPEQARAMEMMMSMGITPPPGMMQNARGRPSCIPQPIPNTSSIPNPPRLREQGVIQWQELPSFRPPITQNSVRADMDGNLWIRFNPPEPIRGGPVFDIVNRQGELVDRLQTPPGYTIVGFGRGRVVYLQMRDREGIHLARVRLR
jgi:hypothetical protein